MFQLLDTFFSFLARKTDYFIGSPDEKASERVIEKLYKTEFDNNYFYFFQMLMSVFNKHRDIALKEKRAEDEKRKQEALKRLQKSQKEKELETKPKLKELTDEEAEELQKELDMVRKYVVYCFYYLDTQAGRTLNEQNCFELLGSALRCLASIITHVN